MPERMPDREVGVGISTQDFIRSSKVRSYWYQTEMYVNLMAFVANNIHNEAARMVIADSIYNFDQVLLQGGCGRDDLEKNRPGLPEHLIQAGEFLARQMLLPQESGGLVTPERVRESGLVLPGDPDFKV